MGGKTDVGPHLNFLDEFGFDLTRNGSKTYCTKLGCYS